MEDIATGIADKYRTLSGVLNETTLRLWAAVEARSLGHGDVSTVARAIGLSRTTVYAGLSELASGEARCRRKDRPDRSGLLEESTRSWSKRTTRFCGISMPSSIPGRITRADRYHISQWFGLVVDQLGQGLIFFQKSIKSFLLLHGIRSVGNAQVKCDHGPCAIHCRSSVHHGPSPVFTPLTAHFWRRKDFACEKLPGFP